MPALTNLLKALDDATAAASKARSVLDEATQAQLDAQVRYAKAVQDAREAYNLAVGNVKKANGALREAISANIGTDVDDGGRVR